MNFYNEANNAIIQDIRLDRQSNFVTITYREGQRCCDNQQTVVLLITNQTIILDERNRPVSAKELQTGIAVYFRCHLILLQGRSTAWYRAICSGKLHPAFWCYLIVS